MALQEGERCVPCFLNIDLILQPVHQGAVGYFPSSSCGMERAASCYLESIPQPERRQQMRSFAKGCAELLRAVLVIVTRWSLQGRLSADSNFHSIDLNL